MRNISKSDLISLYNSVFDVDGNVKVCGREKCIKLIKVISSLSSKQVGDEETGMMFVDLLKSEYQKIMEVM